MVEKDKQSADLKVQRESVKGVIFLSSVFRGKLGEIATKHKGVLSSEEVALIEDVREFFRSMVQELMLEMNISKDELRELLQSAK